MLSFNGIATSLVFRGGCLARQGDSGSGSFRNGEVPDPLVALILPRALDQTSRRLVFRIDET